MRNFGDLAVKAGDGSDPISTPRSVIGAKWLTDSYLQISPLEKIMGNSSGKNNLTVLIYKKQFSFKVFFHFFHTKIR